jgi:hypothetical protein
MHYLVQRDGYSEALVFLGAHPRGQSAYDLASDATLQGFWDTG